MKVAQIYQHSFKVEETLSIDLAPDAEVVHASLYVTGALVFLEILNDPAAPPVRRSFRAIRGDQVVHMGSAKFIARAARHGCTPVYIFEIFAPAAPPRPAHTRVAQIPLASTPDFVRPYQERTSAGGAQ